MFGLQQTEWRDLVLSINIHRKTRRLFPLAAAALLSRAASQASLNEIAEALGLKESSTLRKIISIASLPPEIASIVEWGERRGSISMSAAAEITRLGKLDLMRRAAMAAIQHGMTKEEIRQIVQISSRSKSTIDECIQKVLSTRLIIERSELIIGSLLSKTAKENFEELGSELIERKIKNLMARQFPDVVPKALRISQERFSLLLSEDDSRRLRIELKGKAIESMVTDLAEQAKSY
jgi:hypothetical protein